MIKLKNVIIIGLLGVVCLIILSCATAHIIDKPIIFDQVRDSLTIEYLNTRYKLDSETPSISPKMVVIHHTVIPTFEKSFKAFNNPLLPNSRPEIAGAGNLNVSSHFMVDRDGTIYRLMPETKMARHVIGLNHCSIGIENVGGTKETPLTKQQLNSNIKLVKYLASKYPIEYVIGHYQYTLFENTPLWLEVDDNYRTPKNDPDEQFLTGILNKTTHLNFKPVPVQKQSNTN